MRAGIVVLALVGAVGCSPGPVSADGGWVDGSQPRGIPSAFDEDLSEARDGAVTPISIVSTPAVGLAFDLLGDLARVGMSGVTCNVDPTDGLVTTDFDLPGDGEVVLDGNGVQAVVSTSRGLFLHDISLHDNPEEPLVEVHSEPIEQGWRIDAAAVVDDGVIAVHDDFGDCSMHFGASDAWLEVPTQCPGEISADPAGEFVWFAGNDGVFRVDELGGTRLGPGDHVDWDATTRRAYVASGSVLRAIDIDGVELWSYDMGTGVVDVETVGDRGMVAAIINGQPADHMALFSADGELIGATPYGETGRELTASPDGSRLALRLGGGVAFFDVE